MIVYTGQSRARKLIAEMEAKGWGECVGPGEWPPRRTRYFLDNGAFPAWKAGRPFDAAAFRRLVAHAAAHGRPPDFVVVPDRVAEGDASLAFSRSWLAELRGIFGGVPLYLAVQDGMAITAETVAGFAGVFVGGSLPWKIATAAAWVTLARSLGLPCHIGRTGTRRRVAWAVRIGATSCDSCLPLWSRGNMRQFERGLNDPQLELRAS